MSRSSLTDGIQKVAVRRTWVRNDWSDSNYTSLPEMTGSPTKREAIQEVQETSLRLLAKKSKRARYQQVMT